jgi:hypothetical protein
MTEVALPDGNIPAGLVRRWQTDAGGRWRISSVTGGSKRNNRPRFSTSLAALPRTGRSAACAAASAQPSCSKASAPNGRPSTDCDSKLAKAYSTEWSPPDHRRAHRIGRVASGPLSGPPPGRGAVRDPAGGVLVVVAHRMRSIGVVPLGVAVRAGAGIVGRPGERILPGGAAIGRPEARSGLVLQPAFPPADASGSAGPGRIRQTAHTRHGCPGPIAVGPERGDQVR